MNNHSHEFAGCNVVITGASPDFGETLALAFGRMGARLFLSSKTLEEAETTRALVARECAGVEAYAFPGDLCMPGQIRELVDEIASRTETVDILVNNGSYWLPGTLADHAASEISPVIESTFRGAVMLLQALMPLIRRSGRADIVNVVARCGWPGDRHSTSSETFSASKAALAAFGQRMREELRGSGIRVLQIYPPNFHNTSLLDAKQWNERRGSDEERLPSARNVMDAILFGLRQDRICSIDELVLSNTRTDIL